MAKATVNAISESLLAGAPDATLRPLIDELFSGLTDKEDLLAIFKLFPRRLTYNQIKAMAAAETALKSQDISQLLIASDFDEYEELRSSKPELFDFLVDHVVTTIGSGDALTLPKVQNWRTYLLKAKSKVDLEKHAVALMTAALISPSQYIFEPIVDVVSNLTLATPKAKSLFTLLKDVMIEATGLEGLAKFEKANAGAVEELGSATIIKRKAQLLSLCKLLAGKREATFDDLKKALSVSTDEEVESAVIDATLAGIIDAAVSKEDRRVTVHSVESLKFDKEAWKALEGQLDRWIQIVERSLPSEKSA